MDSLEQKKLHKNANRKVTVTLKKADYEEENTSEVKSDDISVVEMSDNQKTISRNNELIEYLKSIISLEIAVKNNNEELKTFYKTPEEKIDYNPPKKPEYCKPILKTTVSKVKYTNGPFWDEIAESLGITLPLLFFSFFFFVAAGLGGYSWGRIIGSILLVADVSLLAYISISWIQTEKKRKIDVNRYQREKKEAEQRWQIVYKKSEEDFKSILDKYNISLQKYNEEYKNKIVKQKEERQEKEQKLKSISKDLSDKLSTLYSKNILHEKYRNIETVTAIYDYISTGRCQTLEGRDGAYNLYEEQKTKQKTDEQIKELEAVVANLQKELADEQEQKRIRAQLDILNRGMLRDSIQFSTDRLSDSIHDLSMNIDNYL